MNPKDVIKSYLLTPSVYTIGSFESGVSIHHQQVRALNLAWSMIETLQDKQLHDVAVIGAGFAGLTFSAAMMRKGVPKLTIFEKRPVFCPVQQGSDGRWIHPHIYDWPTPGCERPTAGLPVMNWKAGRASDAVAHVLNEWEREKLNAAQSSIREVRNVRYLRLEPVSELEWMAVDTATAATDTVRATGKREFSTIVLAIGFGEEKECAVPYWRNEGLAQPEMTPRRRTFLISGYGDGALIDLCRVRIERFRQDRILEELFKGREPLVDQLRQIKQRAEASPGLDYYAEFDEVFGQEENGHPIDELRRRLRADTFAIVRVRNEERNLKEILSHRSSFQNKLLFYMLFRIGGFIPSHEDEPNIVQEYRIETRDIIRRHGTDPSKDLEWLCSSQSWNAIKKRFDQLRSTGVRQPPVPGWPGGYWDVLSPKLSDATIDKTEWRQEYLPDATENIVAAFVSSVAGILTVHDDSTDNRVTFHRILRFGTEYVYQQTCEYAGSTKGRRYAKGRTFNVQEGIVGLAIRTRRVCRSRLGLSSTMQDDEFAAKLAKDMKSLGLGNTSVEMAPAVRSVLAIPVLNSNGCSAVLYSDSVEFDVFDDEVVGVLRRMCLGFANWIASIKDDPALRNYSEGVSFIRAESAPPLDVVECMDPSMSVVVPDLKGFDLEWVE